MEFIVVSTINGLIYGLLLFMVSAGLTLVFGMMGIINFAHASFYMIGAYLAYSLVKLIGFAGALIVAPILVGIIGIVVERFLLRPVHKFGHAHELLMTFGLAFVAEELMKLVFGNYAVPYGVPAALRFPAFSLFGTDYPFYRIFVGLTALVLFSILFYLLRRTRIGIVVRAAVQRPAMTGALGHNVDTLFMGTFGLGAWMAGVAGVVGGALLTTSPNMALEMGVLVFVVVVVGGLGSLEGAFAASLIIGLLTSLSIGIDVSVADLFGYVGLGSVVTALGGPLVVKLSTFAGAMPVLVMLIVLMVRPAGLFGDRL
ncbi:branched-chain amino acid ABC transporter permease [Bradyrhizobium sp. U87765 SZCCT0131]|uniref:branched-chain amino acid ABC transporter permease n=1 Tax=unclassified Bradyrhizobium TaxID=2631580 RepID=UPI001BA521F9|nr:MULTISPECIES: branched-chain amino acid ABC transporter permease [unclassified Bradyrhizobium]MBR1222488.1 branched-chain amino acid ABC transporter permease [Bradyrhizobium sp. U87765 SZCCT0131]MBR1265431.1 branched-chain amino acid ABC transporter permease [Bradyrhizobium sp. U87765 SZCCT0134]MBR1302790.1 branched-chain amino acid ABC transporter permease [Bradyrhizobium sp. U87765 SZCCT0110]MBR1323488.1 branched-chain amino acid ABC transporter permease [Bradyrhizobium sp. U87765 SZCCT010